MATAPKTAPTQKVRVTRAFYYQGKPVPVDTEIELPAVFAREMIAANKASLPTEVSPAAGPDAGELNLEPGKSPEPDKTLNPGKRGK